MKTIFIFSPLTLPIPAVGGGAVETLITNLINENEKYGRARLVVLSKYDSRVNPSDYKHTKLYFFDDYAVHDNREYYEKKYQSYLKRQKLKRRIFKNRIAKKFYKKPLRVLSPFLFQCLCIAKAERADVVVNEGNWDGKDCEPFYKLVGRDNVYYHLHYNRDEDIEFRRALPNSIAISRYVSDMWAKDKSVKGKNYVLYNGIDLSLFRREASAEEKQNLRVRLGLDSSCKTIIFCGRLIPEKGVSQLLDAFDRLKGTNIKLLLIGNVGFSDNTGTGFSDSVIKRAKGMSNVVYLGYVPNSELPKYYQISDIQVIPSIWQEGAGLVGIEGMASGLPLIITESGGMVEYIDKSCSVQLPIDERLGENLADAIASLLNDRERREKMSLAGKQRAERFSSQSYYENYLGLFDK